MSNSYGWSVTLVIILRAKLLRGRRFFSADGTRTTMWERLPEAKRRHARREHFKGLRADLGLTQTQMAEAMRVSVNTLKGWEGGKPIPEVAFVLAELLHDIPAVRKRLLVV